MGVAVEGELGLLGLRLVREACLSSFFPAVLMLPLGDMEEVEEEGGGGRGS